MSAPAVVRVVRAGDGEAAQPAGDRVVAGHPVQRIWNAFADGTGQFFAGHWSSTPGTWRIRYTETELCVILTGRVVLTDSSGHCEEFGPGETFVIPAGYEGTWKVIEACTKIYAIFEPRT
jgi:hypothetical protein